MPEFLPKNTNYKYIPTSNSNNQQTLYTEKKN